MSKNTDVLSEFQTQNDLSNLCYFNFENTPREKWTEESKKQYRTYLAGMVRAILNLCKNATKEQRKDVEAQLLDLENNLIERPFTRKDANMIYDNRVSKVALEKESTSKKIR